jgi:predicted amidohydrolase YtcJ
MNTCQPVAQAVAIRKNKIVKVGTNQEIKQLVSKDTKVINLNGKTVVPGLVDTHIHVADFGRCLLWLDLTSAQSIKELQSLLKEKAKHTTAGQWIIGRGWNQNRFKEKRLPNVADLDEVAQENPVVLYHETAMMCAVNSKALALAKVSRQTSAPSGGTIDRNLHTGELTGVLRDAATNLVWQVVPEPTSDELAEATKVACQKIVEAGITSVHWIVLSENEIPIMQRLQTEGKLPIRINIIVPDKLLNDTLAFKLPDSLMLRFGGVLIATDGYLDSRTAALSRSYSDDPKNNGKLLYTEQALADFIMRVLSAGLQPVIHAMGDKAIDIALNAIKQTEQASGKIPFRIEQAAVLNEELIKRLRKQNIVISVQPKVISTEFAVWSATTRLGAERAKWLHPLKTLLEEGVKVAGGSDCPMEPLSPLLGMQEAVLRANFAEQRLTVQEALRMYTTDAAYCSGEEDDKGSITVGNLADFTVLSNDPLVVPSCSLKDVTVEMTIINGKVVYSK